MKKALSLCIILVLVLATISGCRKSGPSPSSQIDLNDTPSATVINEKGSITISNTDWGFSFAMPPQWAPTYKAEPLEAADLPENALYAISVFDTLNAEKGGLLFTIACVKDDSESPYSDFTKLGHRNNYNIIIAYPTEIQYDEADAAKTENYNTMKAGITKVLSSFRISDATSNN
ncbi:hypothetical protein AGMMS50284_3970 [Clostridia bacterium]|nr:hypothetical protein AGMMS50284_3970 [Clostridia bacterium]